MKVSELITLLEPQDGEAEVFIMSQVAYPFENAVVGVAVRKDMLDGDDDHSEEEREESRYENGVAPNDVFIVEGQQLRHRSRKA